MRHESIVDIEWKRDDFESESGARCLCRFGSLVILRAPNAMQFKASRWIPRTQHTPYYKSLCVRLWKLFHLPERSSINLADTFPKARERAKGYAEHALKLSNKKRCAGSAQCHALELNFDCWARWEVSLICRRRRKFWNALIRWEFFELFLSGHEL